LNSTVENDYNKNRGLLRYYDPLARLLCVEFDFSPDIGKYFPDMSRQLDPEEYQKATEDRIKKGFEDTAFEQTKLKDQSTLKYYRIGDKMKSLIEDPKRQYF